jgi:hypothetical protein
MSEQPRRSIPELLADRGLMLNAVRRGVRASLLQDAQAGRSVPTSVDGQIVWMPAAEALARIDAVPPRGPTETQR